MKTLTLLALFATLTTLQAATTNYLISSGPDARVEFRSDAPLEEIVGRVSAVAGNLEIDPSGNGSGAVAQINVDLTKLNTGIELRDEHMRKNHLETATYPEAVFTLTTLTIPAGSLIEGVRTMVTANGTLELHGVTAEIQPEVYLTLNSTANTMRIEANFSITLQQFKIDRPQFLVMKLAEEQRISVDITALSAGSSAQR